MQEEVQITNDNIFDEDGFYEPGKARDEFLIWRLEEDGVMTVSGFGRMADYGSAKRPTPPWYPFRDKIRCLIIDEGITELGVGAFSDCSALESVMLPDSLTKLGYRCFDGCTSLKEVILPEETHFSHVFEPDALRFFFTSGRKITMGLHCFRGTPWAKQEWGSFYIREHVLMDYLDSETAVEIPGDVRCIYKLAFEKCGLTKVTFNEGLETVRASAFDGNRLKAVHLPCSVTLVETGAFANNPLLIKVTTPAADFRLEKDALHSTPVASYYENKRDAMLAGEAEKQESARKKAEEEGKKYKPGKTPLSILAVPETREDMEEFPPAYRISASKLRGAEPFSALTLKDAEQMLCSEEVLTGKILLPRMKRGCILVRVTGDVKKRELREIALLHYSKSQPQESPDNGMDPAKKQKKPKAVEELYAEHYFPAAGEGGVSMDVLPALVYFKNVGDFCAKIKASSGESCMNAGTICDAPAGTVENWYLADSNSGYSLEVLAQYWLRTHVGYHLQSKDAAKENSAKLYQ